MTAAPNQTFCQNRTNDGEMMTNKTGNLRRAHRWATPAAALPAAALLGMALLAGCSGSGGLDTDAASGSPSTGATISPTTPATSAAVPTTSASASATVDANTAIESAVAADLMSYVTGRTKALRIRSARVVDVIRFSTPARQAQDRATIATMRRQDIVARGTPRVWVGPVSVVANRADVQYCEKDNAAWYEYAKSGKLAGTRLDKWIGYEFRMLNRDGRWQVNVVVASKKTSCKDAT
jgi:hypothetical protein